MADETGPTPPMPEVEPGEANAEHGIVVLDGPDGVAVAMQPDPAEETGHRLIEAARQARDQGDAPG